MAHCKVRKARLDELQAILNVIEEAKLFLAFQQIPQWQNGFGPTQAQIYTDIEEEQAYVLAIDEKVAAFAVLSDVIDEAYEKMQTPWAACEPPYCSIHRFAVSSAYRGQGLAKNFLQQLIKIAAANSFCDIRIDTHPKNKGMQRVIEKSGFEKKGTVFLDVPDGERYAYQQLINREGQD